MSGRFNEQLDWRQYRGVLLSKPLQDTDDGLRGFGITDPHGYAPFFVRPWERS